MWIAAAFVVSAVIFGAFQNRPNWVPVGGFGQAGSQGNEDGKLNKPFKARYAPGVVVVRFTDKSSIQNRLSVMKRFGLAVDPKCQSPYFVRFFIQTPAGVEADVDSMCNSLLREPSVVWAEPDFAVEPEQALPNDAMFSELWGLHNTGQTGGTPDADVDAPDAWQQVGSQTPVTVAVLDDGVDYTHPDLAANIWVNTDEIAGNGIDDDANGKIDDIRGWDTNSEDNDPMPNGTNQHGTHVAGTIGAVGDNGIGICGVSRNVRVMPVLMYNGQSSWLTDLAEGIDYAWQNGAKVISVSYNIDGYGQALVDAILRAQAADVVYCNSAGNNGQQNPPRQTIRTLTTNTVFVAASDHNDNKASFSNWGTYIEIAAPGVAITSTLPGNSYASWDGTSMATPHVSGAIAVLRSYFPTLTARQVLDRMLGFADHPAGLASTVPGGRFNLSSSIDYNDSTPPSTPTDLRQLAKTTSSVRIQFRASGDDGLSGQASAYEIRIAPTPLGLANFSTGTLVQAFVPQTDGGLPVVVDLSSMPQGLSYMAIRAKDNLGNVSADVVTGKVWTAPLTYIDNGEGEPAFSGGSSTWALTTEQASSPTHSYSDSPGVNYANNANSSLTAMAPIVPGSTTALKFSTRYDLESNYDYLRFEVSTDGGTNWTQLVSYTGTATTWSQKSVSLAAYAGQSVLIRFRLTSDGSVVRDGAYVDDVSLMNLTTVHFDNFEGGVNFTGTGGFALTNTRSYSPSYSWSDGPVGNYANNVNITMTRNAALDLSGLASATLTFMSDMNTESGYDYLRVKYSTNGGSSFAEATKFSGNSSGWKPFSATLPSASNVILQFNFTSDGSVVAEGLWIDDIAISGEPWIPVRR